MEDVLDGAGIEWETNIPLQQLEPWLGCEMRDVVSAAGDEVVGADNSVAFSEESLAEMRSQKTSASGYQYTHRLVNVALALSR